MGNWVRGVDAGAKKGEMNGSRGSASPLGRRLRWDLSDEGLVNSRDPATMARTLMYLFGSGGLLVLLTVPLADPTGLRWLGMVLPALAALAVAGALAWRFDRLPEPVFAWLPPLGTVLASLVVYFSGTDDLVVYSGFYFWVALAAFSFFGLRLCVLNLAWVGIAYATVLVAKPEAPDPVLRWVVLMGTLTVAAVVIALLRVRIERLVRRLSGRMAKQERVAELGRRAVAGAEVAELFRLALEAASECLEVAHTELLQVVPGQSELLREAGTGMEPEAGEWFSMNRSDPLIQPVLASETAVITELEPGRAIGAQIPGRSEPLGVLIAYGSREQSFGRSDAALMEAVTHVLGDALERRRSEEDARHRALHDPLTDRPNRTLFTDRLRQALLRQAGDGVVGVFLLDLDDFKRINDAVGYAAGDELLQALGPRLREALMLSDTVARFGGDEFAVLCEGLRDENDALQVAERIRQCLIDPFQVGGAPQRVGASIGIALAWEETGAEELIAEAEAAMYGAKERSRGSFEFFDRDTRARLQRRLEFDSALREAIELGQLHLAAQPIISLPDYRAVGTEVLLRWRHPRLGAVPPGEFIPVAEETGTIIPIGQWVIEKALALAVRFRTHPSARLLLPLHVNISLRQLAHPEFVATISGLLARSGAAASDLALEITEHAVLIDAAGTVETLVELQGMGFGIVLDDFGTGYSSLSHLKQLPLDQVKIDRMFITNFTHQPQDEAIVTSVIAMAKAFGLHVIAEGVETRQQAERLAELGCWHAQGYLFSAPMPPDELVSGTMIGPGQSVSFRPTALSASRFDS
jgi:diguanylate cyclase (GGDEF)-like protein